MDIGEAIKKAEALYDHTLGKSSRVKEDDLQDLDLGMEDNPIIIKVSVHLDLEFKEQLKKLLQEFMDVFAWDY